MAVDNNTIIGDFILRNTNDAQQLGLDSNSADLARHFRDGLLDPVYGQDIFNRFNDWLVKVPGMQYTRKQSFENFLKPFIKKMSYGNTAIENQVGWVKAHSFDPEVSTLLNVYKAPGAQAYHDVNYQVKFPVTVNQQALLTAFDSEYGLNEYIAQQVQSPINSDEYAMYRQMLQMLGEYDRNNPIFTVHYDAIPDTVETARQLLSNMLSWTQWIKIPSARYNASANTSSGAIATFAKPEELVLMITPDIYGFYQVLGYGMLFNEERAQVPYRVVVVDEFPMPGVFAILCSEDWFQCYDQIYTINSFFDGSTLNTQYNLIHTAAVSASPFAPIVAFGTRAVDAGEVVTLTTTDLTIGPADAHIKRGGSLQLTATLTGTIAPEGTEGVASKPNAASWIVTAEVPATTGANAKAAVPVALNARTRVTRDGILWLQKSGIPTGTVLTLTATSAYANPSGDTPIYTKQLKVTVDD